jgi:two-component system phosphate regulon response regulator PhoB
MKKILIVEDEADIIDIFKMALDFGPYQLLIATKGLQALDMAIREKPDLVLLDIMLPGRIDGYEVCRRLKTYDETKGIYVIILTAKGMDADIEEGLNAGADEYLVKPFKIMPLLKKIGDILDTT